MASSSSRGKRMKSTAQRHREVDQSRKLDFSHWFSNTNQIQRFTEHFQNRKLIAPRYIFLDEFFAHGFQFPTLLQNQHVRDFLINNSYYYPDLVKVFYSNLEVKRGVITSEVKGKKIVVNDSLLTQITGLVSDGARIVAGEKCPFDGYNKMEFYNSLCRYSFEEYKQKKRKLGDKDKKERDILAAGPLYPEDRLLHYVLNWILVPKGSNHAQCSDYELQLMYGIKNGLQIDWPFVIRSNLVKCQSQGDLPYAIFISTIINHFEIETIDENVIKTTIFDQRFGIQSLGKLEIVLDPADKMYKHKDDLITPSDEEEGQEEDNPPPAAATSTHAAPSQSDSSLQLVINRLDNLQAFMQDFREENRHNYEALNARLTAIEDRINRP